MPHKNITAKRAYERRRYAERKTLVKQRNSADRERNRTFVYGYKATHPCISCGEADPVVLEFDHRNPEDKSHSICDMLNSRVSIETLQAEIEKCDVLCANCHRRKTAKQLGWNIPNFYVRAAK